MKILKKTDDLISPKYVLICITMLTVALLIPICMIAPYGRATGDDISNSWLTRRIWLETHSFLHVLKGCFHNVHAMYYGWEGCYTSDFLYAIQPELFGTGYYALVPFINTAIWLTSTVFFIGLVLRKIFGFNTIQSFSVAMAFWLINMEFIPSTRNSLFWWAGSMHYTFAYSLCLFEFGLLLIFLLRDNTKNTLPFIAILTVISVLLGGVNYQISLLSLLGMFLMSVYHYAVTKKKTSFPVLIPMIAGAAGLIVSMVAPGNKVRGGENISFSISRIADTVIKSVVQGFKDAGGFLFGNPFLIAALFAMFTVILFFMCKLYRTPGFTPAKIRYIPIIIPMLFLVYAAMEAPPIFADVKDSTQGVINMEYQVLLLAILATEFLTANSLAGIIPDKYKTGSLYLIPGILVCLILAVVFKHDIKATTSYKCYDYVHSGLASDFKSQMDEQTMILEKASELQKIPHEGQLTVYVGPINPEQGPLMHMPIIEKEHAFTNASAENYYGIDRILMTYDDDLVGTVSYD